MVHPYRDGTAGRGLLSATSGHALYAAHTTNSGEKNVVWRGGANCGRCVCAFPVDGNYSIPSAQPCFACYGFWLYSCHKYFWFERSAVSGVSSSRGRKWGKVRKEKYARERSETRMCDCLSLSTVQIARRFLRNHAPPSTLNSPNPNPNGSCSFFRLRVTRRSWVLGRRDGELADIERSPLLGIKQKDLTSRKREKKPKIYDRVITTVAYWTSTW